MDAESASNKQSPQARGRAFEARVADAYRALGYQVEVNSSGPSQQIDLIARREVQGAGRLVVAIECKDHERKPENQDVQDFVSTVTALRATNAINHCVLVSASGFTSGSRELAHHLPYIDMYSWEELTAQVLNVAPALLDFVRAYENLEIFHSYLSLEAEELSWSDPGVASKKPLIDAVDQEILSRLGSCDPTQEGAHTIFVLADYGSGKTTIARRLQYELAKRFLNGSDSYVPLFVPLRDYDESEDMGTLLRTSLRESYLVDVPQEVLWQRVQAGTFVLLLDGFDEMAERSDETRRTRLFGALLPLFVSDSLSILTSRPSYFVHRGELEHLLTTLRAADDELMKRRTDTGRSPTQASVQIDRLRLRLLQDFRERRPGLGSYELPDTKLVTLLQLKPLDAERVIEYVENRRGDLAHVGATPEQVLSFIERIYDLQDLANRPLLLWMIVSTILQGGIDLSDDELRVGPSGLYQLFTDLQLDIDLDKGEVRQGGLPRNVRRSLSEAIALKMHAAQTLDYELSEILDDLEDDAQWPLRTRLGLELSREEIATDLATCGFIRVDRRGRCLFMHKSFREFFVACVLRTRISLTEALLQQPLEREVLYFLGGFEPTEPKVGNALWSEFKKNGEHEIARRNLLVAYLYTKPIHHGRQISDGLV